MSEPEFAKPIRRFLDDWRTWMVIAYIVMGLLIVWLFVLGGELSKEQAATAAAQAERNANAKASAISQRDGCYTSADNAPDLLNLIFAVKLNAMNSVKASRAALRIDPGGPLAAVRKANIERAKAAVAAAQKFEDRIAATAKTVDECDALAKRLGLEPRPRKEP